MSDNKQIYSEIAVSKYESMFNALEDMDDYSYDKEHASELISSIQMGFIPLEMRMGASNTDFMRTNPDFKFGVQQNSKIENENGSHNVYETTAIKSLENKESDPFIGNDFGSYMGIDTTRTNYITNDGELAHSPKDAKDFKEELKDSFNNDYYKNVEKVFINIDTTRTPKTADNEVVKDDSGKVYQYQHKDFRLGNSATIKDFTSLEIVTFEVHKTDGTIDYKSYFANNSGDILAEIPNSGKAEMLLSDAKDSRCEALNTVNIDGTPPRNYKEQLRERSVISMEAANVIQSGRIVYNAISADNDVEKYSFMKNEAKTVAECLYAARTDMMADRISDYTKIDSFAKEITGEMKYLESLDKTSEAYKTGKESLMGKIEEYKSLVEEYHTKYDSSPVFDNKMLDNIIESYKELGNRLAGAEDRVSFQTSEIVMLSTKDGKKVDTETAFRGLIGMERPTEINAKLGKMASIIDVSVVERGRDYISSKVDEWNSSHPDNPLKISEYDNRVYDKHGLERNIQDETSDYARGFDSAMVDEDATHPDFDEEGNYNDEDVENFVAEDEDIYREFTEEFEISDIDISKDIDELIGDYIGNDKVDVESYGFDKGILKETDDASVSDETDKDDTDNNGQQPANVTNTKSNISSDSKDNKKEWSKPSVRHIDKDGKIELSDKKKEDIKKECRAELKGVSADKYDEKFEKLYQAKVTIATVKLETISEKILDIDKVVNARSEKFGRLVHKHIGNVMDISKADEYVKEYKKAGGAIGEGCFVKSSPSFVDGFNTYMEVINSNLIETGIMEILGKIDDLINRDKNNAVSDDNDKVSNDDKSYKKDTDNAIINEDLGSSDVEVPENEADMPNDLDNSFDEDNKDDTDNENDKTSSDDEDKVDRDSDSKISDDSEKIEDKVEKTDRENQDTNDKDDDVESRSDDNNDISSDNEPEETASDLENQPENDTESFLTDENEALSAEIENENAENEAVDNTDEVDTEQIDNEPSSEENDDLSVINDDEDMEDEDIYTDDISDSDDDIDTDKEAEKDLEEADSDKSEDIDTDNEEKDDAALIDKDADSENTDSDIDSKEGTSKDTDIPEEHEDIDEIEKPSDSSEITSDEGSQSIKDKINDMIEKYLDNNDTVYDKLNDILDGDYSLSEILDMVVDSVSDYFERHFEAFENAFNENLSGYEDFINGVACLVDQISDNLSDFFDTPADTVKEEMVNEMPDSISDNVSDALGNIAEDSPVTINIEGAEYNDLDFDDYTSQPLNESNYNDIEQGVKDNPLGNNDNSQLGNEIDQSIDKDSLINDLISDGGYSVQDAVDIANLASSIQDKIDGLDGNADNGISSEAVDAAIEQYSIIQNADVADESNNNIDNGTDTGSEVDNNTDNITNYDTEYDYDDTDVDAEAAVE